MRPHRDARLAAALLGALLPLAGCGDNAVMGPATPAAVAAPARAPDVDVASAAPDARTALAGAAGNALARLGPALDGVGGDAAALRGALQALDAALARPGAALGPTVAAAERALAPLEAAALQNGPGAAAELDGVRRLLDRASDLGW